MQLSKGGKSMIFNNLEPLQEQEEGEDLEAIIEIELIFKPESPIEQISEYDIPQDDYLGKELERERQEELARMLPKRIP
jgi:hypothetical protein